MEWKKDGEEDKGEDKGENGKEEENEEGLGGVFYIVLLNIKGKLCTFQ